MQVSVFDMGRETRKPVELQVRKINFDLPKRDPTR